MAAFVQTLQSPKSPNHIPYSNGSITRSGGSHHNTSTSASSSSPSSSSHPYTHRAHRHGAKQRFLGELSQCIFEFVAQLLPTPQERIVKEDVRKLLELLIRNIEPTSRLLSFGSTANGFSLRNSDMDLCCLIDAETRPSASDLVNRLGHHLEHETKFHVKPLPHARIPIIKLSLDPSPGLPLGIACDIGFENRLALENTRLLMCYSMIDPHRIQTLVLFLKVWSKRRKINSPYKGTLSSYGYVLLVIFFLVHVKNPPVLPNLQHMPPLRPIRLEDVQICGYNTWFFDDIDLLRQRWQSSNADSIGELLVDWFRYYSRDFPYNSGVASIRAGLLKKDAKGWQHELTPGKYPGPSRERNRFCIEDPFEIDYNVARCVTKDGLYTIRGEFMRAARILSARPDPLTAITELCEERQEEELISPPSTVPPRLSTLPPQTPYTVGSNSFRPKGVISPERLSPQPQWFDPTRKLGLTQVPDRLPPEHMAPKRGKWTSPPPPEAPPADHTSFENKLDLGLQLATSSTEAREREPSSCSNSEILSDDEPRSEAAESDDVQSVRSYTEGSSPSISFRRLRDPDSTVRMPLASAPTTEAPVRLLDDVRLRLSNRGSDKTIVPFNPPQPRSRPSHPPLASSSRRSDASLRRSASGPARSTDHNVQPFFMYPVPMTHATPPRSSITFVTSPRSPTTFAMSPCYDVFYATNGAMMGKTAPRRASSSHPFSGIIHAIETAPGQDREVAKEGDRGPHTPTPVTYSHSHSASTTTIVAPVQMGGCKVTPLVISTTNGDGGATTTMTRRSSGSSPRVDESASATPSSSSECASSPPSLSSPVLPGSPEGAKKRRVPKLPVIVTSTVVTLPVGGEGNEERDRTGGGGDGE